MFGQRHFGWLTIVENKRIILWNAALQIETRNNAQTRGCGKQSSNSLSGSTDLSFVPSFSGETGPDFRWQASREFPNNSIPFPSTTPSPNYLRIPSERKLRDGKMLSKRLFFGKYRKFIQHITIAIST